MSTPNNIKLYNRSVIDEFVFTEDGDIQRIPCMEILTELAFAPGDFNARMKFEVSLLKPGLNFNVPEELNAESRDSYITQASQIKDSTIKSYLSTMKDSEHSLAQQAEGYLNGINIDQNQRSIALNSLSNKAPDIQKEFALKHTKDFLDTAINNQLNGSSTSFDSKAIENHIILLLNPVCANDSELDKLNKKCFKDSFKNILETDPGIFIDSEDLSLLKQTITLIHNEKEGIKEHLIIKSFKESLWNRLEDGSAEFVDLPDLKFHKNAIDLYCLIENDPDSQKEFSLKHAKDFLETEINTQLDSSKQLTQENLKDIKNGVVSIFESASQDPKITEKLIIECSKKVDNIIDWKEVERKNVEASSPKGLNKLFNKFKSHVVSDQSINSTLIKSFLEQGLRPSVAQKNGVLTPSKTPNQEKNNVSQRR